MRRRGVHLQVLTERFSKRRIKRRVKKRIVCTRLTGTRRSLRQTLMHVKAKVAETIAEKLSAAFAPQSLNVEDESHGHEGHAGHRPGGESHFRVHIVSEAFRG